MIKTSMSDIWKKKIDQVNSMISRVQKDIDKTAIENSAVLMELSEDKANLVDTKYSLSVAYMRCLPL